MEKESELFQESVETPSMQSGEGSTLIFAGPHFSYYRIEHDGRYFFFKTYSKDSRFIRSLLRREYELSAALDSPYIARTFLYDRFVDGKEGILMEYIDGRNLTEFLDENPPVAARRRVFEQLLDAVGYLHTKGITHNDLKPSNILISNNGNTLKLIDFGLSDDDAHFLLKTPGFSSAYASPELKEDRSSDVRSDIYSAGKLMALIFGGKKDRFSRKCMRENPEKRYPDIQTLRKKWRNRRRPYKIAAFALLALLVGLAVWGYVFQQREGEERIRIVESDLEHQREKNREQTETLSVLRTNYAEVQAAYDGMKDSLENVATKVATHGKVKNDAVDKLREQLKALMLASNDSLKHCTTWRQMNNIRQNFLTAATACVAKYPKEIDGEDISAQIQAVFQTEVNNATDLFDTHISKLHQ